MSVKKVAIAPCTGLDQPLGTVARMAGYRVLETLRPDETVLLCTPALIAGVEEDVVYARENPVLIIDGCNEGCCEKIVRKLGGKVVEIVNVEKVRKDYRYSMPNSRRRLGSDGEKLVDLVAKLTIEEVDRIIHGEMKG